MSTETPTQDSVTIKDIDGNDVNVKLKLPWGKERDILKIIGELLADIPEDLFRVGDRAPGIALMEYLTTKAPEKVTIVVAKVMGISPDDVDNKFDGDAIFAMIGPLITRFSEKWNLRLGGLPFALPGGGLIAGTVPGTPESAPELEAEDRSPGEKTH